MPIAAAVAPTRANLWPGCPAFVTLSEPGGNSGLGTFLMSRARIRALARIWSIRFCCCTKLARSESEGGFFGVVMSEA